MFSLILSIFFAATNAAGWIKEDREGIDNTGSLYKTTSYWMEQKILYRAYRYVGWFYVLIFWFSNLIFSNHILKVSNYI